MTTTTSCPEGTITCSICHQPMLIEQKFREELGLPNDSHLDCLLKTKGDSSQ